MTIPTSTAHLQMIFRLYSIEVSIDSDIGPLIQDIWSLGYMTDFSCQGGPANNPRRDPGRTNDWGYMYVVLAGADSAERLADSISLPHNKITLDDYGYPHDPTRFREIPHPTQYFPTVERVNVRNQSIIRAYPSWLGWITKSVSALHRKQPLPPLPARLVSPETVRRTRHGFANN